jgi:hypothetical protein
LATGSRASIRRTPADLEQLFDLGDELLAGAEDDDVVVGADHRVVVGHDDFDDGHLVGHQLAVLGAALAGLADDGGDGGAVGQVELLELAADHLAVLGVAVGDQLEGLGGAAAQAVHGGHVAAADAGEELADGGLGRRDGDVDAPALHQVDVGLAVDQRQGAAGAHLLGQRGRHDVVFLVVGEGEEHVGLLDALGVEEGFVGGVAAQHEGVRARRRVFGAAAVAFDELDATFFSMALARRRPMLPPPAMMMRRIGLSMRRSSVITRRMWEVAAMMKTSSPLSMTVSPVGEMADRGGRWRPPGRRCWAGAREWS